MKKAQKVLDAIQDLSNALDVHGWPEPGEEAGYEPEAHKKGSGVAGDAAKVEALAAKAAAQLASGAIIVPWAASSAPVAATWDKYTA